MLTEQTYVNLENLMAADISTMPLDIQEATYQWLFYVAKDQPESRAFKMGMAGLKNPPGRNVSPEQLCAKHSDFTQTEEFFDYKHLVRIATQAQERAQNLVTYCNFPQTTEVKLLDKLLEQSLKQAHNYHPLQAKYLWELPLVRKRYQVCHPHAATFCLIEDYFLRPHHPRIFDMNKPDLVPINGPYNPNNERPHRLHELVDHYNTALKLEKRLNPFVTPQQTFLKAEEILITYFKAVKKTSFKIEEISSACSSSMPSPF